MEHSQAQLGSDLALLHPKAWPALQLVDQLLFLRVANTFPASRDPLYLELHFPLPWPILCLLLEAVPNSHLH